VKNEKFFLIFCIAVIATVFVPVSWYKLTGLIWPRVVEQAAHARMQESIKATQKTLDEAHQKNMKAPDENEQGNRSEPEFDVAAKDAAIIACEKKLGGTAVLGFGFKVVCVKELKP
jgi:hypothetical protein